MGELIDALTTEATKGITELRTLARTPRRRRDDVLSFFTRPYINNGPTETASRRLENLRGIAVGFRNLGNDISRSLLHTAVFKHHLQPRL